MIKELKETKSVKRVKRMKKEAYDNPSKVDENIADELLTDVNSLLHDWADRFQFDVDDVWSCDEKYDFVDAIVNVITK